MRVMLLVLIAFGVAACSRSPRDTASFPLPASPLARAALAEWEAWGRVVIVGWPEARPSDTAATPDRFARLLGYWNTVPGGWRVAARLQDLRAGIATLEQRLGAEFAEADGAAPGSPQPVVGLNDIGFYDYPAWSAAFISAIARRAGVPESDLPSTNRHARYIDVALAHTIAFPGQAPFLARAPEEYAPKPGDLLCADRSAVPLVHWSARLAERGRPRPMHCDVVVRTIPGTIDAVGGNVQGLVALRRFPSDANGRVLPAPFGKPGFVVVLEARDGTGAAPGAVASGP